MTAPVFKENRVRNALFPPYFGNALPLGQLGHGSGGSGQVPKGARGLVCGLFRGDPKVTQACRRQSGQFAALLPDGKIGRKGGHLGPASGRAACGGPEGRAGGRFGGGKREGHILFFRDAICVSYLIC